MPTPLYFDLQVNGYAGVDFTDPATTPEQLHAACARLEAEGVAGILATVITERVERMAAALANLVAARERDPLVRRLIAGFHIEGPFLNEAPGYHGAHPRECVRPADADAMQRLLDAAGGLTRIVTLAPERDPGLVVTRMLAKQGVVVSAGHCNPTLDELRGALDAGLSMFTHLGNGCPKDLPRHDNIIQRALSLADRLWLCFIADGAHVPFFALRNYLKVAGLERVIVVSDDVTPAGLGPGRYRIGRWDVVIGPDMVVRAPDDAHLIGSAITMPRAVANLVEHVGLSPADARRLTVEHPPRAIGASV